MFVPAAGLFAQIVLYGRYLFTLDGAYLAIFLGDLLFIPQPFVGGAASGVVFWGALHWGSEGR